MTVTWADTSHYQRDIADRPIPIDDSYPHPVFCFRTNSGDRTDEIAEENARRALAMLESGKLQAVLPYYFFWPDQANCDLHREILQRSGLWLHPRTATMVDVEDAGARIMGDQSAEVNDEIERLRGWYGDPRRVFGYLNAVANPGLWRTRPAGIRFVTPSYSHRPGVWADDEPPLWMQNLAFAQQWTDRGRCAPWPAGVDLNQSPLELPDLLALLGITGGNPVSDPIAVGAGQLRPFPDKIRRIVHPEHVNESTRTPAEPWPYDMNADVWNNVVYDGFVLPGEDPNDPDAEKHSLVGWVLNAVAEGRARDTANARIEAKLDQLLDGK
ncbi:hypothetical protein [Nocardia wallacei]|uniref:hypothetical protein n=1 Tax=Nocardia wallacei TaxID=480035 RepID=UPI0024559F5C|nr:hypothetical protein [Nocardia wallacei]